MAKTRNSVRHLVERGLRDPRRILPYLRRRLRNRRLRTDGQTHPEFYRSVMADEVARRTAYGAVGTQRPKQWRALGRRQFRFLREHGLERHHRMLEIGCGNLRAGWRFIRYLDAGNYTGIDISPDILLAARTTIVERGLQDKRPVTMLVDGTGLDSLPSGYYDVMHAHSVFSHTPLDVIEGYLTGAARVLADDGFFDFTYNRTDGDTWDFLEEDYYYSTEHLIDVAAKHGFDATPMTGWEHKQDKLRLTRASAQGEATSLPSA